MKRTHLFIFTLLLTGLFAAGTVVWANDYGLTDTAGPIYGEKTASTVGNIPYLIGVIVSTALGLMGIIFFGVMMYGGIRWMTARGNDDLVEKGKEAITAAMIGLVVVLSAYGISNYVFNAFTNTNQAETNVRTRETNAPQIIPTEEQIFTGPELPPTQQGCPALGGMCIDNNIRGFGVSPEQFNPDYFCCPQVPYEESPFTGVDLGQELCGVPAGQAKTRTCCEMRSTRAPTNRVNDPTVDVHDAPPFADVERYQGATANASPPTRCYNNDGTYRSDLLRATLILPPLAP